MTGDRPTTGSRSAILAKLGAGEPLLSLGIRHARGGDIARMAKGAGYEVVWIDLEHSSMPFDIAAQIAATANDLGIAAWVRTPERDLGSIGRLLDCGATGIIAPKVETVEEAHAVCAACRFPPEGARSQIALLPQFGFEKLGPAELARRSNDGVVVQILLETAAGIANVDAIAAVDGVDLLAIGMNDLAADLGCPGNAGHPDIRDACRRVAAAARSAGKLAIVGGIKDADLFSELIKDGFAPLVFAGIDTDILASGIQQRSAEWRTRLAG